MASEIDLSKLAPGAETPVGWVYFILAQEVGRVKIGHARDPVGRLNALRCGSPCEIGLVGAFRTTHPSSIEADLHRQFAEHRLHYEWFTWAPALQDWVGEFALHSDDLEYALAIRDPPEGWVEPVRHPWAAFFAKQTRPA